MKFYRLDPEVAGGFGEHTKATYKNGMIDQVLYLEYEFEGWLGDELVTSTPCFIVTKSLANDITASRLTGYQFEEMEITKSEQYELFYPYEVLPEFVRLIPKGAISFKDKSIDNWSGDDFCFEKKVDLVVSERALNVLKKHQMDNCDIEELDLQDS